jgi:GNAT superfamily N-acetyltransferase
VYDPTGDRKGLRECIVALQDYERQLEPTFPAGEAMADAYLTFLFDQCARLYPPQEYAYISDLVVLPQHRGQGLGGNLLARAEALAREAGVGSIHVGVLAKNRAAHELYRNRGFSDHTARHGFDLLTVPTPSGRSLAHPAWVFERGPNARE